MKRSTDKQLILKVFKRRGIPLTHYTLPSFIQSEAKRLKCVEAFAYIDFDFNFNALGKLVGVNLCARDSFTKAVR